MTPIRRLIVLFWIFIGGMLLWQFYSYNQGVKQDEVTHPRQEHFFFYNTNSAQGTAPAPAQNGANVQQIGYSITANSPGPGSFTAHVTLKNVGNAKATAVQIWVRPYHGVSMGDDDAGHVAHVAHVEVRPVDDSSALSQYGQWASFPDLAPGQSATQTVVFTIRPSVPFGTNPTPQITFQSEKAKP